MSLTHPDNLPKPTDNLPEPTDNLHEPTDNLPHITDSTDNHNLDQISQFGTNITVFLN